MESHTKDIREGEIAKLIDELAAARSLHEAGRPACSHEPPWLTQPEYQVSIITREVRLMKTLASQRNHSSAAVAKSLTQRVEGFGDHRASGNSGQELCATVSGRLRIEAAPIGGDRNHEEEPLPRRAELGITCGDGYLRPERTG